MAKRRKFFGTDKCNKRTKHFFVSFKTLCTSMNHLGLKQICGIPNKNGSNFLDLVYTNSSLYSQNLGAVTKSVENISDENESHFSAMIIECDIFWKSM